MKNKKIKNNEEKAEIKKLYKQINKLVKDKKIKFSFYNSSRADVRIDIWTHFMRECIINYVH